MEDKILHLFKLEYSWYEGEHQSTILAAAKEQEEIEQDIRDAANSLKTYQIEEKVRIYKSDAYQKIISILEQKGYMVCYFLSDPEYYVDDVGFIDNIKIQKFGIIHRTKKIEWKRLKNARNF